MLSGGWRKLQEGWGGGGAGVSLVRLVSAGQGSSVGLEVVSWRGAEAGSRAHPFFVFASPPG